MRPVDQLCFREGPEHEPTQRGDCLRACVATLLELSPERVPHFASFENADWILEEWLADRDYWMMFWYLNEASHECIILPRQHSGLCIVSGKSPRGSWKHACVGRIGGPDPVIVHDPHPSRAGLLSIDAIRLLVPMGVVRPIVLGTPS